MADENTPVTRLERFANGTHSLWSVVRDILHLSGYLALAILLLYTVRRPNKVKDFFHNVGLEHAEVAGIKFDFATVATAANNASLHVGEIQATLKTLDTSSLDQATKTKIESMAESVQQLTGELKTLNAPVKKAVETESGSQTPSQTEPTQAGWMFLGRTDDKGERWDTSKESVPMPLGADKGPKFNIGDTVKVNTDAYLRADGPDYAITAHRIIGVVPEGKSVRIKELRPNNIRSGGKYLWARVEVVP